MEQGTNVKYEHPDCYKPEENNPYPLCKGNGTEECKTCCICADFPGPY